MMKFVWYIPKPETSADKNKEKVGGTAQAPDVTPGRTKLSEVGADLKGFIETFEKMDPKAKEDFLKKAQQWNQSNDVDQIRRAGIDSAENEKDPLKKHEMLSALFLDRDKKANNKMSFKVDFKGNGLAERKVGAGDLLPISAKAIRVQYADGRVVDRAVRTINPATGRIGYYDADALQQGVYKYISVFSGTTVDVLETQSTDSFEVKRRMFAENMEIYNPPARVNAPMGMASAMPGSISSFGPSLYRTPSGGAPSNPRSYFYNPSPAPRIDVKPPTSGFAEIGGKQYEAVDRNFWTSVGDRYISNIDPVTQEPITFMGVKVSSSVNQLVLPYLKEAEARIKAAGIKYDLDTIQCFNRRPIAGTDTMSYHSWGVAFDMDPGQNPQYQQWGNLDPSKRVPEEVIKIMEGLGFRWGGRWENKPDPMHFEFAINPLTSTSLLASPDAQKYKVAILDKVQPPSGSKVNAYASNGPVNAPEGVANNKTKDYTQIAQDHSANFQKLEIRPEEQKKLSAFREKVLMDRARYERVARSAGVPWMLIAAIHERESGRRFDRYLGNGDPLDRPTTHVPAGRGPFPDWESGAIDALGLFKSLIATLGITPDTTDPGKLMAFAEQYNGLGYRRRGVVSPYVYAGTNIYQGGKVTVDNGPINPNVWDKQLGVAEMLVALAGPEDYGPQKKNIAIA